ncbi:hypothetical protein PC9H_010248 [Pleurotus ostreatus]|uniref:Zn(2)-C6 fungal-type domain-containing protein n=1 Tax=Pleurotus ostreatus TaxID=5322 RepID=A0A8H6ZQL6_PLEOS|nr:uncharacterized protein PC9H_010248 [Pleurotus ostreatus]KAF7424937.1 hypothetical protein PC9H_010248 [Pleurotus ostreatus]
MAPTQKRPNDHHNPTPHDPDDERRRREEKRRREDDDIAEADARLEKDERRRRREKLRARRAAEDARVRAAVAEYVAARARHDDSRGLEATGNAVAGSSTGPGTRERAAGRGETAREVEPKGPAREVACLGCVQRNLECHQRLVKNARTCWECKQRHVRCGNGAGGARGSVQAAPPAASAEPTVAESLGELAAQVFDLSVHVLARSEALLRLEQKIDAVADAVARIAGVVGLPADVVARERMPQMAWAAALPPVPSTSGDDADATGDEMEVDGAKAPSTSDSDGAQDAGPADATDEEDAEDTDEGMVWAGTGRAVESSGEEGSEEDSG